MEVSDEPANLAAKLANPHEASPTAPVVLVLSILVCQLGLFLRALRPARTGLCPDRFTRALPEFKKKIN